MELQCLCDMLFIACGMGGGTGTGASPVVAEIAKSHGILTVAVVTTPFVFEGKKRMENALVGIEKLRDNVDAIIIIPNDNLKHVSQTRITLNNAFAIADDVLGQTVNNIVEVIQSTAYINCDVSDICSIVKDSGDMYTATSLTSGINRIDEAIAQIKSSTLLKTSVNGATGIMLSITAPNDVGLEEINKISSSISNIASPDANIIFGITFNETLGDSIKVPKQRRTPTLLMSLLTAKATLSLKHSSCVSGITSRYAPQRSGRIIGMSMG